MDTVRRPLTTLVLICALLVAACGTPTGTTAAEPAITSTTRPPATTPAPIATTMAASTSAATSSTTTAIAGTGSVDTTAFCRATTELNLILVLSAFTSLAGPGAQELQLLVKTPELVAASAEMARTAPVEFAGQAATLADMYETISALATERGLATSDLTELAAAIEDDSLTLEELFTALGTTPEAIEQLVADAAKALGDRDPPVDLLGADPSDLGCPEPAVTSGACDLLSDAELAPLLGDSFRSETTDIQGLGEQCVISGDGLAFVDVTLAGPSYYLPAAWNEIKMIEGLGDEAFLTSGMSTPILYVKQGNTVVSLMVANVDPRLSETELVELARTAIERANEAAAKISDGTSDGGADD